MSSALKNQNRCRHQRPEPARQAATRWGRTAGRAKVPNLLHGLGARSFLSTAPLRNRKVPTRALQSVLGLQSNSNASEAVPFAEHVEIDIGPRATFRTVDQRSPLDPRRWRCGCLGCSANRGAATPIARVETARFFGRARPPRASISQCALSSGTWGRFSNGATVGEVPIRDLNDSSRLWGAYHTD